MKTSTSHINKLSIQKIKKEITSLDWMIVEKMKYEYYFKAMCYTLKKIGLVKIDSGAYSVVYSSPNLKYVIKIIRDPASGTYRRKYGKLYLQPIFISNHRCVAIQKKVPVLDDIIRPLHRYIQDSHNRNIGIVNNKCVMIDLD